MRTPFALLFVTLAACQSLDEPLSKDDVRSMGKSDDATDYCAEHHWYGDGTCDNFCPHPDSDCAMDMGDAPLPASCEDGELFVDEPSGFYVLDESTGMECPETTFHCLTKDTNACPSFSPIYCPAGGTIKVGAPRFTASSDGMECEVPSQHCVTNDFDACPQLHPVAPDFCSGGEVVVGPSTFIPSTDGMECQIPNLHCVQDGCPTP